MYNGEAFFLPRSHRKKRLELGWNSKATEWYRLGFPILEFLLSLLSAIFICFLHVNCFVFFIARAFVLQSQLLMIQVALDPTFPAKWSPLPGHLAFQISPRPFPLKTPGLVYGICEGYFNKLFHVETNIFLPQKKSLPNFDVTAIMGMSCLLWEAFIGMWGHHGRNPCSVLLPKRRFIDSFSYFSTGPQSSKI